MMARNLAGTLNRLALGSLAVVPVTLVGSPVATLEVSQYERMRCSHHSAEQGDLLTRTRPVAAMCW